MNKSDLIAALTKKEKLTEKNASVIVNLIFDDLTDTLKKDGRIDVRGFGAFSVRHYGAYTGRSPKTEKAVEVKPKRLPYFRTGLALKKLVNG